jgi:uncharacterized cupin superfamily protein
MVSGPVKRASDVPVQTGTRVYPPGLRERLAGRHKARLGNAVGLSDFGVNITRLDPGAWSALRHWHEREDEFVYVLEGEVTLIDDAGEHRMAAGEFAGFPAGVGNGHHLVNKSDRPAVYFEVGSRRTDVDVVHYPDQGGASVRRS